MNESPMFFIAALIALVVVLVFVIAIDGFSRHGEFTKACEKRNGAVVWNGRNWECMK